MSSTIGTGFLLRSAYGRIESGEQKTCSFPFFSSVSIAIGSFYQAVSEGTSPSSFFIGLPLMARGMIFQWAIFDSRWNSNLGLSVSTYQFAVDTEMNIYAHPVRDAYQFYP